MINNNNNINIHIIIYSTIILNSFQTTLTPNPE